MSDLRNLVRQLAGAGVQFAIVGGYAGVVHGCTYVTQDIDICCDFSPANLLALQRALCDVHPVHRVTPGRRALKLVPENATDFKTLCLDTDIGRLDCLCHIDSLGGYEQVKRACGRVEVEGVQFHVLAIDSLIATKEAMNRPRDREAIRQLQAINRLRRQDPTQ